jgi:hypothetical protein
MTLLLIGIIIGSVATAAGLVCWAYRAMAGS